MTRLMNDIEDLDVFAPDQVELTRLMDRDKGGTEAFVFSLLGALTKIHGAMAIVSLPSFQRGAYEAHARWRRTGEKSALLLSSALWRTVKYMQEVRSEALERMKDPEVATALASMGKKLGIDLIDQIERENES